MRLSVECGGFTEAADACRTANQTAALLTESLTARLADCAGMAGNDASSSEFATAYDAGAREAIAALADLTHAFIGAGRLLAATGDNHAAAEAASAGLTVAAYVGGSLDDDSFVRISPSLPPSSLGAQEPSLGRVDAWILDHVEGFVWPGADVSSLRSAGSAWRRCASSVAGLAGEVNAAIALLGHQRSPEVPVAVAALEELAVVIGDTAWQLDSLAVACEEYAAAVEEAHARTRELLGEIAQMAVEGAVVSVVVTGLTGGLGGGAAATATLARIRAYAPRFHALLLAFRAAATTAAARLRTVLDELADLRGRVEKFLKVPARNEAGTMKNPLGWGMGRRPRPVPSVDDPKLTNYIANLFKGVNKSDRVGDGTTMDAIRHELATGESVQNRMHLIKGRETLRGLEKWLRTHKDASEQDRNVARDLISELKEALNS